MILVAGITLETSPEQEVLFAETATLYAEACNLASEVAFETKQFHRIDLQNNVYHRLKAVGLGAQHACLACRQVAAAYAKGSKTTIRTFRPDGAVPMDVRTFSVRGDVASVWTTDGRQKVTFATGEHQVRLLAEGVHEQADLVCSNGQWRLLVSVEVESPVEIESQGVLGVDLGIVNLATDSEGEVFSGRQVKKVRHRRATARSTFQRRNTRSAKRRLRKLSGREKRFRRWVNHNVSKKLVCKAGRKALSIALEDLKGLGKRKETAPKPLRKQLGGWAFSQLRNFVSYKAERAGVGVVLVEAAYSSQTCSACGHCEKANRKSREGFECASCGHAAPADENAARVIRARGATSHPHQGHWQR